MVFMFVGIYHRYRVKMISSKRYVKSAQVLKIESAVLCAFTALDDGTLSAMSEEQVREAFRRSLLQISVFASVHGWEPARELLASLRDCSSSTVVRLISHFLDTGRLGVPASGEVSRQLQQEFIHFSRIVDLQTVGLGEAPIIDKRLRRSTRIPRELKVLTELLTVSRGRLVGRLKNRRATIKPSETPVRDLSLRNYLIQYPSSEHNDHVLIVESPRRKCRNDSAFLFWALLDYLQPQDAFSALTAWYVMRPPARPISLILLELNRTHLWSSEALLSRSDSIVESVLNCLPVCRSSAAPLILGDSSLQIHGGDQGIEIVPGIQEGRCLIPPLRQLVEKKDSAHEVAKRGVALFRNNVESPSITSIECGHLHLDRDIGVDQDIGMEIGINLFDLLVENQTESPFLAPMMDDDHVLVHLKPEQYRAYLLAQFADRAFHLIPESSVIVRSIAVALHYRLQSRCDFDHFRARGRNLFLALPSGEWCELFEDYSQSEPITGCVLFEAALLIYRSNHRRFDRYFMRRFGLSEHPHITVSRLLGEAVAHDVAVQNIDRWRQQFSNVTNPHDPDVEVCSMVDELCCTTEYSFVHLNVLEDYYESQQQKVRSILAKAEIPIVLLSLHFNSETGRVSFWSTDDEKQRGAA